MSANPPPTWTPARVANLKRHFENGLTEHEFDHVYSGVFDGAIKPDPDEVKDYCFKSLDEIEATLQSHPSKYTAWFHIAFPKVVQERYEL